MGNIPLQAQGLLPVKAREGMVKSEDCLYINVFKPLNLGKNEEEKLPIMVWGEYLSSLLFGNFQPRFPRFLKTFSLLF